VGGKKYSGRQIGVVVLKKVPLEANRTERERHPSEKSEERYAKTTTGKRAFLYLALRKRGSGERGERASIHSFRKGDKI